MKIVEPRFEVLAMPDGEQALALLERIGRVAYKSEDRIEPGEWCRACNGTGKLYKEEPCNTHDPAPCHVCNGTGWTKEPSSHKFIRMIMQAERKAKTIIRIERMIANSTMQPELPYLEEAQRELANDVVQEVYDFMRENPAHESVIEHCGATVLFVNNRGFTHEGVRHRLASFTQSSTRYCNFSKGKFGHQIEVGPDRTEEELHGMHDVWQHALETVEEAYLKLTDGGVKPQIARDVLPTNLIADIVITANFREWIHIFNMRCSKAAHPDMRSLMIPLREEFQKRVPILFEVV